MTANRRIVLSLTLMAFIAGAVLVFTMVGKNSTLVRNSLVAASLAESGFDWAPGEVPADYLEEKAPPPPWFAQRVDELGLREGGLGAIQNAVRALHTAKFVGKPIQGNLRKTWQLIEGKGRGYCADYSKLFTAMMNAAHIPVREWALGHENFGSGHTFNEVYIDGQWVFVDAFNGMMVRDLKSAHWLSVLEFRERLEAGGMDLDVIKLTAPDVFFQTSEEGLNYYSRSTEYFYMLWGRNVFGYESNPWVAKAADLSRSLERAVAIVIGEYPGIRMLETDANGPALMQVKMVRVWLYLALALELMLGFYVLKIWWCDLRRQTG